MGKKLFIIQSNYIPWKGYFDAINMADEVIILDNVQYTKGDWRNRNKIKTPQGVKWLTIPIKIKGCLTKNINQIEIADKSWAKTHWKTLYLNYKKAKNFHLFENVFFKLYEEAKSMTFLSDINLLFIKSLCQILEIKTIFLSSDNFEVSDDKNNRLLSFCQQRKADCYISGPSAKSYIDEKLFKENNIFIEYLDYSDYPEYNQLYGNFTHEVSIIDLIFHEGKNSCKFMKSFN